MLTKTATAAMRSLPDAGLSASIGAEILAALRTHGPQITAELVARCPSAETPSEVSRVIYRMRQAGQIESAGKRSNGLPGRGNQIVHIWRVAGSSQDNAEPICETATPKTDRESRPLPPGCVLADAPSPAEEAAMLNGTWTEENPTGQAATQMPPGIDATEAAIMDLVDQADEAILAYADQALGADRVWQRLRRLQDEVFGALCNYRAGARVHDPRD